MNSRLLFPILITGAHLVGFPVHAQWVQQSIPLNPGWNAVFLEVQPEPAECDTLFDALPIDSVWAWNRRSTVAQFIQDPSQLLLGDPDWLTYLPPVHNHSGETSLYTMSASRPYLIRVSDGAAPFNWTVTGRPVARRIDWLPDSLNFVGFHVRAASPPTFQQFLSGTTAHAGQPVFQLNPSGRWEQVNAATTSVMAGRAYWVTCSGPSSFSGPIELELPDRTGIHFGSDLVEDELRIRNPGNVARQVTVTPAASLPAPASGLPGVAGPVPLSMWVMNLANQQHGWEPFLAPATRTLAPGEEWRLRLEVRRTDMPAQTPGSALFQSLLEISDASGSRRWIGVSAATSGGSALPGAVQPGITDAVPWHAGLWVGSAVVRAVSQPSRVANPTEPMPTPAEFQFRLLVHVDHAGRARLLQRVLQMRREPTYKPDPDEPGRQIIDQPGRTVLLTDETLAAQYDGSAVRDGRIVGRRLSSAVFAFSEPIPLEGTGEFGANELTGVIALAHDDPLNPFQHRYHPDHDNLDDRFEQLLPEGRESFAVTRRLTLEFTADDPEQLPLAGWGDAHLGGYYRERIEGLHRHPIHLSGTFRLQRASRLALLNDAP